MDWRAMSATIIDSWLGVTLYLIVVGATLEAAHRAYYRLQASTQKITAKPWARTLLTVMAANMPFVGVCAVTYTFCRFVNKQSPSALGIRPELHPTLHTLEGAAVAFLSVALVFAAGYFLGWFRIQSSRLRSGFGGNLPAFCGSLTNFVSVSILEELVMRGYVLSVLCRALGPTPAVIFSAIVFSVVHLFKRPQTPMMFTLNAFLFGVMAGWARLATGALWMPIGLHMGWNLASACVFGLPIAGKLYDGGLITCSVEGPSYITGGRYSPDAGLLGTAALAFATSALVAVRLLA